MASIRSILPLIILGGVIVGVCYWHPSESHASDPGGPSKTAAEACGRIEASGIGTGCRLDPKLKGLNAKAEYLFKYHKGAGIIYEFGDANSYDIWMKLYQIGNENPYRDPLKYGYGNPRTLVFVALPQSASAEDWKTVKAIVAGE
jgi:hypothetical protein